MNTSKKKFVLLSNQRSGSTAFRLLLNSHNQIRCHDEVLLKESGAKDAIGYFVEQNNLTQQYQKKDYHGDSKWRKKWLYPRVKWNNSLVHANNKFTTQLIKNFLESLFNNPDHSAPWESVKSWNNFHQNGKLDSEKAIGFKLMYYELDNQFIRNWLKENNVSIIHLVRRNKLERILSTNLAKARQSWHSENKSEQIRIHLDTRFLLSQLADEVDETDAWSAYFDSYNTL